MSVPKATNNFVFIIRDATEKEKGGLIIPGQGQEKPHTGKILSVGGLVQDKKIKDNDRVMFHKGNGFHVEHDGIEYLVIEGEKIIARI